MWVTDGTGGFKFSLNHNHYFYQPPISEWGREREGDSEIERDVFNLAVVWPNGPSKMCANQLAQLTLEMVCQPVNLEQSWGWEATLMSAWQLKGADE